MSFGEDVKAERLRRGWSQQELADRVGTTQSTIDRVERGESARSRLAPAISAVLEIGIPTKTPDGRRSTTYYERDDIRDEYDKQPLEVYPAIEESDGKFKVLKTRIAIENRINVLRAVKGAFALSLINYDMEPAYEAGDWIYVHPHLPPIRNSDVLLAKPEYESEYTPSSTLFEASLARLLSWDAESWLVKYWNFGARGAHETRLQRNEWPHAYRVVGRAMRI